MNPVAVADLIRHAPGGRIVGRTKLQKSACLLELAGVGYGFPFVYRLYGPFSEELQVASDDADALGFIDERKDTAAWGGWYSMFSYVGGGMESPEPVSRAREALLGIAAESDSVQLELAVTAAFLAAQGYENPWAEVRSRKASKATVDNVKAAQDLYSRLRKVPTPQSLPSL
jgi:hypothetical protein